MEEAAQDIGAKLLGWQDGKFRFTAQLLWRAAPRASPGGKLSPISACKGGVGD